MVSAKNGVGSEVLDVKTRMPALELRQRFSTVSLRVVQDRDHRAARLRCWRFGLTETPKMTEILSRG